MHLKMQEIMDTVQQFGIVIINAVSEFWKNEESTKIIINYGIPLLLILIILLYMRCKEPGKISQSYHKNDTSICQSPECVRCHKYKEYKQNAMNKLTMYAEETGGWNGLGRLIQGLKSSEHLKSNSLQNPNVMYVPGLLASPWWNAGSNLEFLELTRTLHQNYTNILREFCFAYGKLRDANLWKINNTPTGIWSAFYFYNQGQRVHQNCEMCPVVSVILDSTPNFMRNSLFGNASFSVLHPGTDIEPHYGPTNTRIRCHFGLRVPEKCLLKVGEDQYPWQEKEVVYFDDSFLHSAVNHANKGRDNFRAILLLDHWHPGLSQKEICALKFMFGC